MQSKHLTNSYLVQLRTDIFRKLLKRTRWSCCTTLLLLLTESDIPHRDHHSHLRLTCSVQSLSQGVSETSLAS